MLSCQNFSFQQPTVCGKELCCAKRCPRSWCCTSVPFAGGTWTVGQDSADTHQPVCNVGLWLKCDATRNGSRADSFSTWGRLLCTETWLVFI